ncbi:MAG TPA: PIG-L deacetylase family protein [Chitinophagaceae bacterium]|nr:PIG-L deacetylase family protein [Chitinophagaceae bacterium]
MALLNTRRQFIKNTGGGLGLVTLPSLLFAQRNTQAANKKIICVGGHPDDPESGCGGTIAKLRNAGHEVTIIYLTTGEAGIPGKNHTESASIRKQEAINACKVLDAKPVFAGQIDGDSVCNNEWVIRMQKLIANEKPDIVFTHWPLDTHKDHQVASLLTIQSWVRDSQKFSLYFFEVCTGEQTFIFHPTDYVDISDTQEQKRKAVYCHTSQDPDSIYSCGHAAMEEFRGRELGVKAAEGFVRMSGKLQGGMGF